MNQVSVLSIKAEWAYFVCSGIKDIEYRSRNTHYRGTLYIHASGEPYEVLPPYPPNEDLTPVLDELHGAWDQTEKDFFFSGHEKFLKETPDGGLSVKRDAPDAALFMYGWTRTVEEKIGYPSQCIIGKVDVVDSRRGDDGEDWEWVLENPVLFQNPITHVKGKLGIWKFNLHSEPTVFVPFG